MTQEQFEKSIELKKRLDGLNEAKNRIDDTKRHRLSYIEKSGSDWSAVYVGWLEGIDYILDRHDVQIRKEIDEEIQKIYKEIEQL